MDGWIDVYGGSVRLNTLRLQLHFALSLSLSLSGEFYCHLSPYFLLLFSLSCDLFCSMPCRHKQWRPRIALPAHPQFVHNNNKNKGGGPAAAAGRVFHLCPLIPISLDDLLFYYFTIIIHFSSSYPQCFIYLFVLRSTWSCWYCHALKRNFLKY